MLKLLTLAAGLATAAAGGCSLPGMKNFVTFGDSYTDESRLEYFANHGGKPPPPGMLLPPSDHTASGGYTWGRFVANNTNAMYYNYAVSGAMCSNEIVTRIIDELGIPYPSVREYELPAFMADLQFKELYPDLEADNTVYALWIGTNDLGSGGFLGDHQHPGKTLTSFLDCTWETFDRVYASGGRHFVLFNQAPFDVSPMYVDPGKYGTLNSLYLNNKDSYNTTQYKTKLQEYINSVNTMYDYGAPFQLLVEKRWPGASISIFDVHSLMSDILDRPGKFLTAPAVVDRPYHVCPPDEECTDASEPRSSYFWYDELHKSERVDEVIAENFVEVVMKTSKYGTYYKT